MKGFVIRKPGTNFIHVGGSWLHWASFGKVYATESGAKAVVTRLKMRWDDYRGTFPEVEIVPVHLAHGETGEAI